MVNHQNVVKNHGRTTTGRFLARTWLLGTTDRSRIPYTAWGPNELPLPHRYGFEDRKSVFRSLSGPFLIFEATRRGTDMPCD